MTTVHIDITDGSNGVETRDGLVGLTRIAVVEGLSGSGQGKILAALAALTDAGAGIGSFHPACTGEGSDPVNIMTLESRRVSAIGPDSATVILEYKQTDTSASSTSAGQKVRFASTLRQVETNKDANGDLVWVEYIYPTDPADPNYPHNNKDLAGKTVKKSPMFAKLAPEDSYQVARKEDSLPIAAAAYYVGTVNTGGFSVFPNAVEGHWLCMGILADGPLSGPFDVSYEFGGSEAGWNSEESVFIDELRQCPPSDLVTGVGIKVVEKYLLGDFDDIHLPDPAEE